MMTSGFGKWMTALVMAPLYFGLLCLCVFATGDDSTIPTFKKRGDAERRFYEEVALVVMKAAHPTGVEPTFGGFELTDDGEKKDRKVLVLKMQYKGKITRKVYDAEARLKVDTRKSDTWELLSIDYKDNNNISANRAKIDEILKKLNR